MDYAASWEAILNRHLQFRCKLCPDGTGQFADIVGGDAWFGENGYPEFKERDGRSLVITRTDIGEEILLEAEKAGVLVLNKSSDFRCREDVALSPSSKKKASRTADRDEIEDGIYSEVSSARLSQSIARSATI